MNDTDNPSIYPALGGYEQPDAWIDKMDWQTKTGIYRDIIKENIEYDTLCLNYNSERVNEILELILEAICSRREYIRISGEAYPAEAVKSRFLKLGQHHIEYAMRCFDMNTAKIHNIKAYLLTSLYNAPATMGHYYKAEISHNMLG